jgi:hypothetical protein
MDGDRNHGALVANPQKKQQVGGLALPLALFKLFVAFFLAADINEVDQANNERRNH